MSSDLKTMLDGVQGFHIHVYFNKLQEPLGRQVWEQAKKDWGGDRVGRFHTKPVGPHTTGSFQVWVNPSEAHKALNWTTNNRNGLKAMIHKVTDDDFHDHTESVTWYGDGGPHILDTSIFKPK
ncbi:MAG: DOPA 4,5-dioxygenase family protein [Alphaproteobacteria bacterium]|nr:DOPA 4,5-dioxygenase family protein [Alphaproteobacteria bacterium]